LWLLLTSSHDFSRYDFVDLIYRKVVPAKIGNGELAKDVVEDRCRAFDLFVSLDLAGRLEARGGECVDEFLERDAVSLCMSMKISPRRPPA
jgi:hypothetical protein